MATATESGRRRSRPSRTTSRAHDLGEAWRRALAPGIFYVPPCRPPHASPHLTLACLCFFPNVPRAKPSDCRDAGCRPPWYPPPTGSQQMVLFDAPSLNALYFPFLRLAPFSYEMRRQSATGTSER